MPDDILPVEDFEKHVAYHQMEVIQDNGLHRHLKFKHPETNNRYFGLVTWPGYLCFYGDMGEYVFSRLPDMFEFFRGSDNKLYRIDFGYWAEKMQAVDRRVVSGHDAAGDGYRNYSSEKFRAAIQARLADYCDARDCTEQEKERLADWVETFVLSMANDGPHFAIQAALDFKVNNRQVFPDFWDEDLYELDYGFVWCCYALRWGINRYDASQSALAAATAAREKMTAEEGGAE